MDKTVTVEWVRCGDFCESSSQTTDDEKRKTYMKLTKKELVDIIIEREYD